MKVWRVPFEKFGEGVGLHRVGAIAAELGLDLSAFGAKAAAIVGSNGKGSTAAMLASILASHAGGVGRFTSPHLLRLNERFSIDGEDISDDELDFHWRRVEEAARRYMAFARDRVGGFEFLFLIAADWFTARGCAQTVWEAGIGGRYDPVRLIQAQGAALTALDLEHTALLGGTLELIAYDKLDVAPAGARVFASPVSSDLRGRLEAYARLRQIDVSFVSPDAQARVPASLPGDHQRANAALATALAKHMLVAAFSPALSEAGLAQTSWPGRLETIETEPLIVIDVGHTPDAIRQARAGFECLGAGRPAILVLGASVDKNADDIVAALAPGFSTIMCAAARHKGRSAAEIAALASLANSGADVTACETVSEARAQALLRARAQGAAIYVAGGLFLAAEFKAVHQGVDLERLAFF